jgi:hypothetical protein
MATRLAPSRIMQDLFDASAPSSVPTTSSSDVRNATRPANATSAPPQPMVPTPPSTRRGTVDDDTLLSTSTPETPDSAAEGSWLSGHMKWALIATAVVVVVILSLSAVLFVRSRKRQSARSGPPAEKAAVRLSSSFILNLLPFMMLRVQVASDTGACSGSAPLFCLSALSARISFSHTELCSQNSSVI